MGSDEESLMGGSELGAVGKGSDEESTSSHGERRPRARRVRVAHRWLEPLRSLETDWKKGGQHIQLLLDIDAHLPNGKLIALKILVDTGAQVNLIKEKLGARQFFKSAENLVKLITANNTILEGGSHVVKFRLNFNVVEDGFLQPHYVFFLVNFSGPT